MLGYFGDIQFETSDKKVLTFNNLKRDIQSRWAKHNVIGKKPTSEFLGADLDTITFDIQLNANNGVKPVEEMNRWLVYAREGHADILVIGKRAVGMDKWTVESVSQMWGVIFRDGEVFNGKVSITLKEYIESL